MKISPRQGRAREQQRTGTPPGVNALCRSDCEGQRKQSLLLDIVGLG